ncbi:hypothetical protein ACWEQP_34620 [Streptomyces sp. NPDC004044]
MYTSTHTRYRTHHDASALVHYRRRSHHAPGTALLSSRAVCGTGLSDIAAVSAQVARIV